ncbi:MAG: prepilin peptidase, partial [archaeon]
MTEVVFLFVLALIWIVFAVVQDLRSREVANWLNFSLIVFALGFRFFYSLFSSGDFSFFYQGLIGLGIFFVLGNLFYYGRMFAGGDAKLMIALGAVLPLSSSFLMNIRIFILFFFLFLFVGIIYGFSWSLVLGLRNFSEFKKEFSRQFKKNRKPILGVIFFGLILIALGFFESLLLGLGALIIVLPYLYIYAKSVDEACMIKNIQTRYLTEGDWLYKDIKVGNKVVKATWDGVSKKDIELLRKKKSVVIRQGIPFTPVFLISFLILGWLWIFGNMGKWFWF